MNLTPDTIVDRYTIERLLGEGGMAIVYRARHNRLATSHAIKVLKIPHTAIQERLLQEGRVQAQLNHPNIVSVTDVIEVSGAPGLVMEFIEGSDLEHLLRERRLTVDQVDALARGILEGVAAAHALDLIHRDLKPANILLADDPTRPGHLIPKITDFGLAKLLDPEPGSALSNATRSGVAMGTPAYMAPEQIRSARDVEGRADVFSLGAILYEMVTGVQCWRGDDILDIFNAIASGDRDPVRALAPDLPERMASAIEGALQTDPDARIADVATLLRTWTGETEAPTAGPFAGLGAVATQPRAPDLPDSKDTIDADSQALATMALPPPQPRSRRRWTPWIVALAAVFALGGGLALGSVVMTLIGSAGLWASWDPPSEIVQVNEPEVIGSEPDRAAEPSPAPRPRRRLVRPSPSPRSALPRPERDWREDARREREEADRKRDEDEKRREKRDEDEKKRGKKDKSKGKGKGNR